MPSVIYTLTYHIPQAISTKTRYQISQREICACSRARSPLGYLARSPCETVFLAYCLRDNVNNAMKSYIELHSIYETNEETRTKDKENWKEI